MACKISKCLGSEEFRTATTRHAHEVISAANARHLPPAYDSCACPPERLEESGTINRAETPEHADGQDPKA